MSPNRYPDLFVIFLQVSVVVPDDRFEHRMLERVPDFKAVFG